MPIEEIKHIDPDVECFEKASLTRIDPEEEKALVRKIDVHLLPCIWIMYLLSYMDVSSALQPRFLNHLINPVSSERTLATPRWQA